MQNTPLLDLPAPYYQGLRRADGAIALAAVGAFCALTACILWFVPKDGLYALRATLCTLAFSAALLLVLAARHQPLITLGFAKKWLPWAITAGLTAAIALYSYLRFPDWAWRLGRWGFYLVGVATSEELVFRGFAFTRLRVLFGHKWAALLVCGALFGAGHAIRPILFDSVDALPAVLNTLGGGVLGQLMFQLVYTKTGHILYPILLHALLDYSDLLWR